VSVVAHAAAREYADMVAAVDSGDLAAARAINDRLLPAVRAIMTHTQGAITAKVVLQLLGVLEHRTVRGPLPEATDDEVAIVRDGLVASGLLES
jgi:4-hydroxy-tetrahydrodipicolinate synthase